MLGQFVTAQLCAQGQSLIVTGYIASRAFEKITEIARLRAMVGRYCRGLFLSDRVAHLKSVSCSDYLGD
jgi:hypothetical protein